MVKLILGLVLTFLVIRALLRLGRGVLEGVGSRPRGSGTIKGGVELVRDPVCGTFVVPDTSLGSTAGGRTHYFCSEKCRRDWVVPRG